VKSCAPRCQWAYGNVPARSTDVISGTKIHGINVKFIKIKTGCQYIGYLYYSENKPGPHAGRGLDIADVGEQFVFSSCAIWRLGYIVMNNARQLVRGFAASKVSRFNIL